MPLVANCHIEFNMSFELDIDHDVTLTRALILERAAERFDDLSLEDLADKVYVVSIKAPDDNI